MTSSSDISPVEKLTAQHQVRKFACGENSLDVFLRKHALKNQMAQSSQTYVVHRNQVVVGYFTLVFGSVTLGETPLAIAREMPPSYPVPVMLLARWAVDKNDQGKGIGKALLKEALLRTVAAAEIGGLRAIIVDALNEKVAAYYKSLGFVECPIGERRLMIPIETCAQIFLSS
jgi:predicted N-acetyltransferase YhbS